MFIEKLANEDLEKIFYNLIKIIEKNEVKIREYFKNSKIRMNENAIIIEFNTGTEWEYCYLKDFRASVSLNFNYDKQITSIYRKFMYNKFGNNYYNQMRDFYKKDIVKKYDKELEKLSTELNEMIK